MGGSLVKKLAIYFALFSVVPLLLFSCFALFKLYENAKGQFDQKLITLSDRLTADLNSKKKQGIDWMLRVKQDQRLPVFIQGGDSADIRALLRSFSLLKQSRVRIYDNTGMLQANLSTSSQLNSLSSKIKDSSRYQIQEYSQFFPNAGLLISAKSAIFSRAKKVAGSIIVDVLIGLRDLESWAKEIDSPVFLVSEVGKPLYSTTGPFRLRSEKDFNKKKSQSLFQVSLDSASGREVATFMPLSKDSEESVYFGVSLPKSLILNPVIEIMIVLISFLGIILLFVAIFSFSISRSLLSPFYYLVQQVQTFDGVRPIRSLTIKEPDVAKLAGAFQKMADRIQKMRSELEQKVTELEIANRESQLAQDQLLQSTKMASLGQLVAGVAHELNNPISFIQGNIAPLREYCTALIQAVEELSENNEGADVLNKYDIEFIKSDLPKLLGSFDEGTKRTREIISGLRNFSRQEKAAYTEINFENLIEKAIKFVEPQIKTRIEIQRQYAPLPKVWCVESQISQVFVNLFTNAIQSIKGEGKIWVSLATETKGYGKDGGIRVSVQDSGSGIKEENLSKIFDPFFTTKAVGEGTGLGLSISYGIVKSHGGEVKVRSKPGVGTEFIVTLPVRPPSL